MPYKARVKFRGKSHPVQDWARRRGVKAGTLFPAPFPLADKPNSKKGKPVPYNNEDLLRLKLMNGNNENTFRFLTRIGGWLFNLVDNRHLVGLVKGLLAKWAGKFADSYVPYPLPKGKKAFATNILCDGNIVEVDKENGKWVHIKPGIAYLVQVGIGTGTMHPSNVRWEHPGGWAEKALIERI